MAQLHSRWFYNILLHWMPYPLLLLIVELMVAPIIVDVIAANGEGHCGNDLGDTDMVKDA